MVFLVRGPTYDPRTDTSRSPAAQPRGTLPAANVGRDSPRGSTAPASTTWTQLSLYVQGLHKKWELLRPVPIIMPAPGLTNPSWTPGPRKPLLRRHRWLHRWWGSSVLMPECYAALPDCRTFGTAVGTLSELSDGCRNAVGTVGRRLAVGLSELSDGV